MKTPLCDFVRAYARENTLRLHMPGHKGVSGAEHLSAAPFDLTEIDGADVLYAANGVIAQSEANASALFGSGKTLYSAEGSSLCIRAMVYLTLLYAKGQRKPPLIFAARNAHKAFALAAATMNVAVKWLLPSSAQGLVKCELSPTRLDETLTGAVQKPTAVYITSPDYLGNVADVKGLSAVCKKHGVLLLVDNAHGAYLRFLPQDMHPLTLGADVTCDSAHKTLPVYTGGAYLHLNKAAPAIFYEEAQTAMATFASTSPSYLILQSLDGANAYLGGAYREKLAAFLPKVRALKAALSSFSPQGEEELKLTLAPKSYGYTGTELAKALENEGIVCEFSDPDYCVMMLSPELTDENLHRLQTALCSLPKREAITDLPPALNEPRKLLSMHEALFSPSEEVPVAEAIGRILSAPTVSCPPAVPVAVCGEEITEDAIACFAYYGIKTCRVVKQ